MSAKFKVSENDDNNYSVPVDGSRFFYHDRATKKLAYEKAYEHSSVLTAAIERKLGRPLVTAECERIGGLVRKDERTA